MSDLSWPLQRAAQLFAGDVAVVVGERSVTYGELACGFLLLVGGKRVVRSRDKLDIWYDGKRETKTRDPISGSAPG